MLVLAHLSLLKSRQVFLLASAFFLLGLRTLSLSLSGLLLTIDIASGNILQAGAKISLSIVKVCSWVLYHDKKPASSPKTLYILRIAEAVKDKT